MFNVMFSGRWNLDNETDEDGNIFIDRDGIRFKYILEYLEIGMISNISFNMLLLHMLDEFDFLRNRIKFF